MQIVTMYVDVLNILFIQDCFDFIKKDFNLKLL